MFEEFHLSDDDLFKISNHFKQAMVNGLRNGGGVPSLPMLPSYIVVNNQQPRDGTYLGVDFGGTNFRMALVQISNGTCSYVKKSFSIPIPNHIKSGSGHRLFEFIASSIQSYTLDYCQTNPGTTVPMGFTFSYPTQQTGPSEGFLIQWAKNIQCNDVVGAEIVSLLQQKLNLLGCPVRISALLNDTVAAIMSYRHAHPSITTSSIFGTGTNGAYIEQVSLVARLDKELRCKLKQEQTIVNTEWGSFWCNELHQTKYDIRVDEQSLYPGKQRFEKMISGRYLNEIIMEYKKEQPDLFQGFPQFLSMQYVTELTGYNAKERDNAQMGDELIEHQPAIDGNPNSEFNHKSNILAKQDNLRQLCIAVVTRAARLGAIPVACCLQKTLAHTPDAGVCVDGSLYGKNQHFRTTLQETVSMLVGKKVSFFNGTLHECSCLGAAMTVAMLT